MMDSSSQKDTISNLIAKYGLPCFVKAIEDTKFVNSKDNKKKLNLSKDSIQRYSETSDTDESTDESEYNEIVYLGKIINANCAFARGYDSENEQLYNALKNQRESNVSAVPYEIKNKQFKSISDFSDLIYEDHILPTGYEGLLQIVPENAKQVFDSLDHETDIISFASRLKNPKNYFLAKPLKVFELVSKTTKTSVAMSNDLSKQYNSLYRRWVTLNAGTICVANKVLMVIYPRDESERETVWERISKRIICCKKNSKVKFEVAIEFKVLDNVDQLKNDKTFNPDEIVVENKKTQADGRSYYLPIYHVANDSIDLIPIAPPNMTQKNSLQNFMNLIQNENINFPINVKIKVDKSFNNNQSLTDKQQQNKNNNNNNNNNNNDICKFYEIYMKKYSQFIIGYSFKQNRVRIYSIENESYFKNVNREELVLNYGEKNISNIEKVAYEAVEHAIKTFQLNIHKVEFGKPSKLLFVDNASTVEIRPVEHGQIEIRETSVTNVDDGYSSSKHLTKTIWKRGKYITFPKYAQTIINKLLKQNMDTSDTTESTSNKKARQSTVSQPEAGCTNVAYVHSEIIERPKIRRTRSRSLPVAFQNIDYPIIKDSFTNVSMIIQKDLDKVQFPFK